MIFKIRVVNKIWKRYSKLACGIAKLPRFMPNPKPAYQTSSTIRSGFIDYFLKHDHKYVESCSLNSKSSGSYFVNSGVSQFKEHILGNNSALYGVDKAVNSQRCVRIGGKTCDLNNIGYDSTHLSYFEMLGNWSFGSYDKSKACKLMWKFLTEELQLPSSHLYVTYFGGSDKLGLPADDETRDIWFNLGIKDSKVLQFGEEHNFWEMGPRSSNPLCGTSTEIHWDYLATMNDSNEPRCARCFVNSNSPEVTELWNCVFMQYQWSDGGTNLTKLPSLIIDTGMGLERLSSVIQGVSSVFDTDGFKDIMNHLSEISKAPSYQGIFSMDFESPVSQRLHTEIKETTLHEENSLKRDIAYRIIADHIRTLCLCLNDGIRPGRTGYDLKVRHLLQRSLRQSRVGLGMTGGLSAVVDTVCQSLNQWYNIDPLVQRKIKNIIDQEEKSFFPKLNAYEKSFDNLLIQRDSKKRELSNLEIQSLMNGKFGESISYDMIRAMCRDADLIVNEYFTYDDLTNEVVGKSNVSESFNNNQMFIKRNIPATDQTPLYKCKYNQDSNIYEVEDIETTVTAMLLVSVLNKESYIDNITIDDTISEFGLLTTETNMYATKGGQDCDNGVVLSVSTNEVIATVNKVTVLNSGHVIHWCTMQRPSGSIRVADKVVLRVDNNHRTGTTLHHTGHHIVFATLNKLLGKVNQTSSSVKHDQGKMEFAIDISMGTEKILSTPDFPGQLERICRDVIKNGLTVLKKDRVKFSELSQDGSVRYLNSDFLPEEVRLVTIGDMSEVCCGTHADNTSHLQDIIISRVKQTNQSNSEIGFVVGNEAVKIRQTEQKLRDMCAEIIKIPDDNWRPNDSVINTLKRALGKDVLSRTTRDYIAKSVVTAEKYAIEAPSITDVLDKRFSSNNAQHNNTHILWVTNLGIKKAMKRILELKVKTPVVMYDSKNVLVYYPEKNIVNNIREFIKNSNHVLDDFIVELPNVTRFDAQILNQFVSIYFPKKFEERDKFVVDVKNLIEHLS